MTTAWRLLTFLVGTALLVSFSFRGADPLWTPWSSVLAAIAAYFTAPRVFDAWVGQRKVTVTSLLLWYIGAALPFDITQLVCTGTWRLDWAAGNLVASTALLLAAGLVWCVDLRRFWLPAGSAATIGVAALASWALP